MKTQKDHLLKRTFPRIAFCGLTFLLIFLIPPSAASGQDGYGGGMGGMMGGSGARSMSKLEQAKKALRVAKSERARFRAQETIRAELTEQYESFLKENESELSQMESRLRQLRSKLKRRTDAKDQLVELELQRISNEAAGLVWPQDNLYAAGGMDGGGMGMGGGGMGGGGMGGGGMGGGGMGLAGGPGMGRAGMGGDDGMNGDESEIDMDISERSDFPGDPGPNNLHQIALGCLNHESAYMNFPTNFVAKDGTPLLSWRVAILPYVGENELYKEFHLDEPWDSEHNIQLLKKMPAAFKQAGLGFETKTVFLGFEGSGTMFEPGKKIRFSDITDGSSNTILCAETKSDYAVEWTKPFDIEFDSAKEVTQLAETLDGRVKFVLGDGSTQAVPVDNLDQEILKNLIQRNDGVPLDFE